MRIGEGCLEEVHKGDCLIYREIEEEKDKYG